MSLESLAIPRPNLLRPMVQYTGHGKLFFRSYIVHSKSSVLYLTFLEKAKSILFYILYVIYVYLVPKIEHFKKISGP